MNRNYIISENTAHNNLVKKGYNPQQYDFKAHQVVVFKIYNVNTNAEHKDIYSFNNWQEADNRLR